MEGFNRQSRQSIYFDISYVIAREWPGDAMRRLEFQKSLAEKKLAFCQAATGQRAQCPEATSASGGRAREHSGTRRPQRGSKAQPGGSAPGDGTVPSMAASGRPRSVRRVGTAPNSPRV